MAASGRLSAARANAGGHSWQDASMATTLGTPPLLAAGWPGHRAWEHVEFFRVVGSQSEGLTVVLQEAHFPVVIVIHVVVVVGMVATIQCPSRTSCIQRRSCDKVATRPRLRRGPSGDASTSDLLRRFISLHDEWLLVWEMTHRYQSQVPLPPADGANGASPSTRGSTPPRTASVHTAVPEETAS